MSDIEAMITLTVTCFRIEDTRRSPHDSREAFTETGLRVGGGGTSSDLVQRVGKRRSNSASDHGNQ